MIARALLALVLAATLGLPASAAQAAPTREAASAPAAASATPAAVPAAPVPTIENNNRAPVPLTVASPSAGNLLQTIAALMFVLGLLAVFAWAMKRYGPRHSIGGANVKLVGALNLGGRERILVVEVGEQWIVVGASPGRVNALATMPKQESEALVLSPQQQPASGSFAAWLKQTVDKRNAN